MSRHTHHSKGNRTVTTRRSDRHLVCEELEQRTVPSTFRSIDGSGNNEDNPTWGAAFTQLRRLTTVEYADGVSEPKRLFQRVRQAGRSGPFEDDFSLMTVTFR